MTPKELKQILNISERSAYQKFNNETSFKMEELVTLSEYFNIRLDKLVTVIQAGKIHELEKGFKWD